MMVVNPCAMQEVPQQGRDGVQDEMVQGGGKITSLAPTAKKHCEKPQSLSKVCRSCDRARSI